MQKSRFKNATGVDTSKFAKKTDLANIKSDVEKLDIYKLQYFSSNFRNLKSKVDKQDTDKLVPAPVDLSKLSDVVKIDVFKKDVYNAKIKNIENKIPDITNLATNTTLNAKINHVKDEIPNINNLATTSALTAVENKIHIVSYLVKKTDYDTKLIKLKRKSPIIIMINTLLLQNLICLQQTFCFNVKTSKCSKQK